MKAASDTLFRLIKAMSQTEKTYFKRNTGYSKEEKNSHYIRVFDAINSLKVYDEAALIASFEGERFSNNFSEIKKYLKGKILKSLRDYHAQNSLELSMYEQLGDIEMLYKKGLYKEALAMSKRTRKTAKKYELFDIQLLLNKKDLMIEAALGSRKGMESFVKQVYNQEVELLRQLASISFHRKRYYQIHLSRIEKGALQPMEDFAFDVQQYPYTAFDAARFYYASHLSNGHRESDKYQQYEYAKAAVALFTTKTHWVQIEPKGYCSFLFQHASACRLLGKNSDSTKEGHHAITFGIQQLDSLYKKGKITKSFWVERSGHFYVERLLLMIQHEEVTELRAGYNVAKKFMIKHAAELINARHLFNISALMMTEIVLGNWSAALQTYQQFNDSKVTGVRTDSEAMVRMYAIIAHYKRADYMVIDSLLTSTYQFLRNKAILFEFEKLFFNFFRKLIILQDLESKRACMRQFSYDMETLFETYPSERIILTYFDFQTWIESQLNNQTMLEILQERSTY